MKRHEGDRCRWEDPAVVVEPQPFALAEDLETLRNRVQELEQLMRAATSSSRPVTPFRSAVRPRTFSETEVAAEDLGDEAAAKVLEEIAMGRSVDELGFKRSQTEGSQKVILSGSTTSIFCEEALAESPLARSERQHQLFEIYAALPESQAVCDQLICRVYLYYFR